MTALRAIFHGLGRSLSSPGLVLLLWVASVVAALPAVVLMAESIRSAIGPSQAHETLRGDLELGWWSEYADRATGIETSFTPSSVSAAAFFDNLDAWFSGELFSSARGLLALGGIYALLWIFLLGGVLDYLYTGPARLQMAQFLGGSSRYFGRFFRLTLLSGGGYFLVYRLSRRLFPWVEGLTRDVTVERTVLIYNLLAAAAVVFGLTLIHLIADYAKIAMVLEDRRSAVLAAVRGLAFVLSHPLRTLGIYYGLGLATVGLSVLYFLVAPHPGGASTLAIVAAFLVGQVFLLGKLVLRVATYGAQMALYDWVGRRRAALPSLGGPV